MENTQPSQDNLQTEPISQQKNKKKNILIFLVIITLLFFIISVGYLFSTKKAQQKDILKQNTQLPDSSTHSPSIESNNCLKDYKNEALGFSFMYPCAWGEIEEQWLPTVRTGKESGNQLILRFKKLGDSLQAGGSSNDFRPAFGRGPIDQDIHDKYWKDYLAPDETINYFDYKIEDPRIINQMILPYTFILEDNNESDKVEMPQFFNDTFYRRAYFNIDNIKISILGFEYHFVSNEEIFLQNMNKQFSFYVTGRYKLITEGSISLEEAKAYNQDVEQMQTLLKNNQWEIPFDDESKKKLAEFDAMVASFKFTK